MLRTLIFGSLLLCSFPLQVSAADLPPQLKPMFQVVDLDVGESAEVTLADGSAARVKLIDLKEFRDEICFAVRRAEVTLEVNGERCQLVSANYQLPQTVGKVQLDCPITKGCNVNGTPSFWGLDKAARIRLWPAKSPLLQPGTFLYPAKQRWFASDTQMANEPTHVDGGERAGMRKIYYHSGLDIGGSEGLVEVVAATDSLVVSVGEVVLEGHKQDTPVAPRYDVVYLLDGRGWYYRYSHLKEIDKQIVPGRLIAQGDRVGLLGKEGGSGGWSHLHFEISSRQPSGKWGTQDGYAFLWEAYLKQYQPQLLAVARPHHLLGTGDSVTLDGSKSWIATGQIATYQWQLTDGTTADGPSLKRTYSKPGRYSEILRVADAAGNVAYDFAVVIVVDKAHPERHVPSIHANYYPTMGIKAGDPVTFKVRTFNTSAGKEQWDYGDGTNKVDVQSDGNRKQLAPDGYAVTTHRYQRPGDYIVRVTHTDEFGVTAIGHLHVRVNPQAVDFQIEVTKAHSGYNGKTCWVHGRAGTIPAGVAANPSDSPLVVLTMQKLDVSGSDVFFGLHDLRTDDLGKTWVGPKEHVGLNRVSPKAGIEIVPCDFTPKWHRQTGKLLGTGATFWYDTKKNSVIEHSGSETCYAVYDPEQRTWSQWQTMSMPDEPRFEYDRAGCTQRYDLPNGDILLPVYFKKATEEILTSAVVRCQFDGKVLKYVEQGNSLSHPTGRGLAEPSLTKFGAWFYLTLRNNDFAAVTRSSDGLQFEKPKPWTFDDGQPLGSYNTQAHWITHSDGLFLAYTRKGANNDHVFRHRAPLFIARVDPERMVIMRKSERILVPERGAGLGNFGIVTVNDQETWAIATEWMQTWGPNITMPVNNKYGADNSVYVSKIRWNQPNKLASE